MFAFLVASLRPPDFGGDRYDGSENSPFRPISLCSAATRRAVASGQVDQS